jgi:ribulose-5-phosphate 4-epimerase/fuculose-1-phosphate aldolase
MEEHEAVVRRDLAAAHTLSHHYGFDELVWNHISARLDEEGHFLVTPGDLHFDEVGPSQLVLSSSSNVNVTSDVIHSTIYNVRPDVGAIVHHHTPAVVAVSAMEGGLQFLTQDSAAFYGKVAYHPWEGVSDDYEECARIAEAAANGAHTIMMCNHGALTLGATVAEAWVRYYYLDRVCQVQCSIPGGRQIVQPDKKVLEHAASQYEPPGGAFRHGKYEWESLLRLASRVRDGRVR